MSFIASAPSARSTRVRQQRHLAAVLHRGGDVTLMLAAVAGHPASPNLAAVGDELPQQGGVLVVDVNGLVLAERANLLLRLASRWLDHRSVLRLSCGESRGRCGSPGGWESGRVGVPGRADERPGSGRARPGPLEGRLVRVSGAGSLPGRRSGDPRVVVRWAAKAAAGGLGRAGRAEPAAGGTTRAPVDLGGHEPQRRPDLVDLELHHRPLLTLLRLEGALLEAATDDDPGAPGERLGDVFRRLPPDVAAEEQRLAVLPLVRLPVEHPRGGGDGEVRHRAPLDVKRSSGSAVRLPTTVMIVSPAMGPGLRSRSDRYGCGEGAMLAQVGASAGRVG